MPRTFTAALIDFDDHSDASNSMFYQTTTSLSMSKAQHVFRQQDTVSDREPVVFYRLWFAAGHLGKVIKHRGRRVETREKHFC